MLIAGTIVAGAKLATHGYLGAKVAAATHGTIAGATASGHTGVAIVKAGWGAVCSAADWWTKHRCITSQHGLVVVCPKPPIP